MVKILYEDGGDLTREQIKYFIERMDSGDEVEAGSLEHRLMTAASERAMRITSRMNSSFTSLSDTRAQLEELFMRPLREGVGLFPPFTTDCGLNTHLGEGVFINAGCRFQDQGGIFIGDRALIGHNLPITFFSVWRSAVRRCAVPRRVGARLRAISVRTGRMTAPAPAMPQF